MKPNSAPVSARALTQRPRSDSGTVASTNSGPATTPGFAPSSQSESADSGLIELQARVATLEAQVQHLSEQIKRMNGDDEVPDLLLTSIQISPDDDFIGRNWYPPETSPRGTEYRWSGPGSLATIKLPLQRQRRLKATLLVSGFEPSLEPSLRIYVDGEEIKPLSFRDGRLKFIVPPKRWVSSYTELGFLTTATAQPKDDQGQPLDDRWLGFVFAGLEVVD